jgi:hypothetical protein
VNLLAEQELTAILQRRWRSYRGTTTIDAVEFTRCPYESATQIGKVFTPGVVFAGTRK